MEVIFLMSKFSTLLWYLWYVYLWYVYLKVAALVTRHDDLSIGDKFEITESISEGFS